MNKTKYNKTIQKKYKEREYSLEGSINWSNKEYF